MNSTQFNFRLFGIEYTVNLFSICHALSPAIAVILVLAFQFYNREEVNVSFLIWVQLKFFTKMEDYLTLLVAWSFNHLFQARRNMYNPKKISSKMLKQENLGIFNKINATVYALVRGSDKGIFLIHKDVKSKITQLWNDEKQNFDFDKEWGQGFDTADYGFNLIKTVEAAEKFIEDGGNSKRRLTERQKKVKARRKKKERAKSKKRTNN